MPKARIANTPFVVCRGFTLAKRQFRGKVTYTCKSCDQEVSTPNTETVDNAGRSFLGATCSNCSSLNMFCDKNGNYIPWARRVA